ncbi:MAG: hypothetical protein J5855_01005 [Mailhella sp.]|nr:hypothetical protein [Mailhella sp.]
MRDSNITVDTAACLACGRCVDRCIMDNLRLVLPPCRQASALGINYQGVFRLLAAGKFDEAAQELRRCTPFAGILHRLGDKAPANACTRGRFGGSLNFEEITRWLAHSCPDILYRTEQNMPEHGLKASVVGHGFAALQSAYDLRMRGCSVNVYEVSGRDAVSALCDTLTTLAGKTNRDCGEPKTREEADKTIHMFIDMGISFTDAANAQISLEKLCAEYDAVLLTSDTFGPMKADENYHVRDNLFAAAEGAGKHDAQILKGIVEGKNAAHAVRNFLEGFSLDYEKDERTANGWERFGGLTEEREDIPALAPIAPVDKTFNQKEIMKEAARCLGCGRPVERNLTCWYCLPCEVVCPTKALHVRIPYLIR